MSARNLKQMTQVYALHYNNVQKLGLLDRLDWLTVDPFVKGLLAADSTGITVDSGN